MAMRKANQPGKRGARDGRRHRRTPQAKTEDHLVLEPSAEVAILNAVGLIPEGSRVLDLGCGRGDDCVYLAGAGCSCVGIDMNRTKIKYAMGLGRSYAEGRLGGVNFIEGDVRKLESLLGARRRFDFVLDRLTSSNLSIGSARKLVRSIASVAVGGGIYCLVFGADPAHAPAGEIEVLPALKLGKWFSRFEVACKGLPKAFHGAVRARPVLTTTLPAKAGNCSSVKLCLLSRRG